MEVTSRECIDVKVVPDLLQFIALRARLEDLDGIPIININDVPLQGFNSLSEARASTSRCRRRRSPSVAIPFGIIAFADPQARRGAGLLPAGAHGPRRQARSRSTSSDRCSRMPKTTPGRSGRATTTRDARRSAAGCAARPRRAAAVLERVQGRHVASSARGRSVRSSSSSSSTASRSTCCATRSRPGSPAGLRSTGGAATHRSRSASSTTSITSRTGRSRST